MAVVLVRGAWRALWKKYPFFYFPLLGNMVASAVVAPWVLLHYRSMYGWYWAMQFATMFAACGNFLEILRHGFSIAPNARLFAQSVRYMVLGVVGVFATLCLIGPRGREHQRQFILFERDFRTIQAFLLLVLVAGIFYFGIQLGKNVKGILLGYGIYIGSSLVALALDSRFPSSFSPAWQVLQPLAYVVSLLIYLFSLWTYGPAAAPFTFPGPPSGATDQVA